MVSAWHRQGGEVDPLADQAVSSGRWATPRYQPGQSGNSARNVRCTPLIQTKWSSIFVG